MLKPDINSISGTHRPDIYFPISILSKGFNVMHERQNDYLLYFHGCDDAQFAKEVLSTSSRHLKNANEILYILKIQSNCPLITNSWPIILLYTQNNPDCENFRFI